MSNSNRLVQAILAGGALLGWFALIVQLYLLLINRTAGVAESIVRYFSFYTILTNFLVSACFTISLISPLSRAGNFFLQRSTVTAIGVYITVVGLVYNFVLRSLWEPTGMQRLVDELLHTIIPLVFVAYWLLFEPKTKLKWGGVIPWLIYPLVYLMFILARGAGSGYYPYPFVDVKTLGYSQVLLNCVYLCLCFVTISLVFVVINQALIKNHKKS